jgi:hypothetical protein
MRRLLVAGLLCVSLVKAAAAQHGFWQPDERVLITSFHMARGIATDQRYVYIATTHGLEIYDQSFRRWLLPSTAEDGYPVREGPGRIVYDSRERGVWLVTDAQTLYVWSSAMQRWEQRSGLDLSDELRRELSRTPDDRDPALAIMRNFAGRDANARTWQVTALAAAERPGTYWASTYGGNFSFVDSRNLSAQPFTYGTLSRGVSAITLDARGQLYFGGDAASPRTGITRADTALQNWEQFESRVGAGPQLRVNDMLSAPTGVYAAARDGIFVLRSNRWQKVSDAETAALAYAAGRVWAGTRGTLGWIDATDNFTRADFPVQTVRTMAARNDTLWVGASGGVFMVIGENAYRVSDVIDVIAMTALPERMLFLTPRGLQTWEGTGLGLPVRNAHLQAIGAPVTITTINGRVYIGGEYGVAEWNPLTDQWRHLSAPHDVPQGPVFDIAGENGRLWLATPSGALRLQWN